MELTNIKRIWKSFLDDIATAYIYIFGFYIIVLLLAFLFPSWRAIINWLPLHASIAILGILSLFSNSVRTDVDRLDGIITISTIGMITRIIALLIFFFIPIFIAINDDILAGRLAIYAFYFLVISVIAQIIEYKKSSVD